MDGGLHANHFLAYLCCMKRIESVNAERLPLIRDICDVTLKIYRNLPKELSQLLSGCDRI